MSIRNLNKGKGVSNGTRLILNKASNILLHCTIATGANNFICIYDPNPCNTVLLFCFSGDHAGEEILIPRIELTTKDGDFPFQWKRRQFPVRPAFAMTINKSQGIYTYITLYVTLNTDISFRSNAPESWSLVARACFHSWTTICCCVQNWESRKSPFGD